MQAFYNSDTEEGHHYFSEDTDLISRNLRNLLVQDTTKQPLIKGMKMAYLKFAEKIHHENNYETSPNWLMN